MKAIVTKSELNSIISTSAYNALLAGLAVTAALFAFQGQFWAMSIPLYAVFALQYVIREYKS